MGFFDTLQKAKGGYLFLSHSHADIEKVRVIRNQLEQQGFEPLCFYLKCLDDDSEIEDLIKREIDARDWFIFMNSESSRKSKWVTLEREYITRTNSKKILTMDLNDDKSIYETIKKISHNLRVFISYSHKDEKLARRIKKQLEEKDYLVFFPPDSIPVGMAWNTVIKGAIEDASKEGCVIALLTESSINSDYFQYEIISAIQMRGNILPIVIGDVKLDETLKFILATRQMYYLPENPTDVQIKEMIDKIGQALI